MQAILEICAGTYTSVLAAARGGAQRVELCSALGEGGLTPSAALIESAASMSQLKTNVLIRPRSGDFLYTPDEQRVMLSDIRIAGKLGASAIVVGALDAEGHVDCAFMKDCVEAAHDMGMGCTFHRAFDMCAEPEEALERIITLGFDRLLTSGQAATAEKGVRLIARLVEQARDRIAIMPGSGVNAANAVRILKECGAREIHASARCRVGSRMKYRRGGVQMGASGQDEYQTMETSEESVKAIVDAVATFHA